LPDLGVYVRKGDQTTVAGLVLAELARLPKEPGDVVIVGRWRFRVTGVEGNRITSVTIDAAPRKR
jgi:putative hemolysin